LLLYDFDVSIGDTVFQIHLDSSFIIINSIDSILINNQYRKKYNFSLSSFTSPPSCGWGAGNSYVEGIGNISSGLLGHWANYFESNEKLSCFEDDEVFYSNVDNCETVGLKENLTQNILKIYPNPTSEKLFITLSNKNVSIAYSIFDISGKEVASSILNQSSFIDVSNFNKGLYLLKLKAEPGSSKSTLISIQ
ncbi:MAG: T9SS type A sorting domain-containing protein, partial [Vicingaceae bacterium]|nr:T9SS type A sorting domain-containing protein [Vicingaceae bacterium]